MLIASLDLGAILLENFISEFSNKILNVFFQGQILPGIGHISRMVGLIDVKQKGGVSVGYWMNYVTLAFDLTHDLDLGFFKVKCRNSCTSGIVGLINMKRKRSKSIKYWANYI